MFKDAVGKNGYERCKRKLGSAKNSDRFFFNNRHGDDVVETRPPFLIIALIAAARNRWF